MRLQNTIGSLILGCVMVVVAGCGKTEQTAGTSTQNELSDDQIARDLIKKTFATYRQAKAYRDQGFVRLSYSIDGQPHQDTAPLSVKFERPNRISISSYTACISSDGRELKASLIDPASNHFDGQCLCKRAPLTLSIEDLYADPTVAQSATAGMGGPAPQLELLLSERPLAAWLDKDSRLVAGSVSMIDGHSCRQIEIESSKLLYTLWVDQEKHLIRRIELPWQAMAPELAANPDLKNVALSIELDSATFSDQLAPEFFEQDTPPLSRAVSNFVTPPPLGPHRFVGSVPSSFSLANSSNRFRVTQNGSDRKATLMLWIANHEASLQAARAMQQIMESLTPEALSKTRVLIVMAEPSDSTGAMLRAWGVSLPWADDTKMIGRDVFQISEAPCLVLMGPTGTIDVFENRLSDDLLYALPEIINEIVDGQPVGERAQQQYVATRASYLRALTTIDFDAPLLRPYEEYAQRQQSVGLSAPSIAAEPRSIGSPR